MKKQDFTAYRYTDALFPNIYSICGVELRPLCLGHLMILEKLENPVVSQIAADYPIADGLAYFYAALLVCALSYEDNIKYLNDETLYKELMDEFTVNLIKNMEQDKSWNIFAKMSMFREYFNYYMDVPIYVEERTDTSIPTGTDWKQNIYLVFKKLGYKDTEIYNMNIRRLFYEWCSYMEGEGGIKVMNRYDLQSLQKL